LKRDSGVRPSARRSRRNEKASAPPQIRARRPDCRAGRARVRATWNADSAGARASTGPTQVARRSRWCVMRSSRTTPEALHADACTRRARAWTQRLRFALRSIASSTCVPVTPRIRPIVSSSWSAVTGWSLTANTMSQHGRRLSRRQPSIGVDHHATVRPSLDTHAGVATGRRGRISSYSASRKRNAIGLATTP
jgi:hypothetical protein